MRKVLLPTIIFIATILLVLRLFYLQVIDDTLKLKSDTLKSVTAIIPKQKY